MDASADFLLGKIGRGSNSGDEQALQGAEVGVPVGVWNSALSSQASSRVSGAVNGVRCGTEGRRSWRDGGTGVWMGACGWTSMSNGLIGPAVRRAGCGWWSADGNFDEPGTIGVDCGDEWATEVADERLEVLEVVEVVEVDEAEECVRRAGRCVGRMDV